MAENQQDKTKTQAEPPKLNAARLVSSAIIGEDFKVVMVGGRRYVIKPPTIKKLAGAAYYLALFTEGTKTTQLLTEKELLEAPAKALSWLIYGDGGFAKVLQNGTPKELASALEEAYKLISVQDFLKLSTLAKNVSKLTANTRQ